jgi:putative DNA methylase
MTYRKKLIEVALPLEAINRESAREKSIRHGHPSTLHLWWARRPLAACRAVLFASLVDDPSSLTEQFPTEEAQEKERQRLFRIIEELVKWDNSDNPSVIEAARAEIVRSTGGQPPPVLDPFCGGGSIPLEAQRLGLVACASDLNPVAVLITKALIEIPPKFGGRSPVHPHSKQQNLVSRNWTGTTGLAEDVRYYGQWVREEAKKRIGHLYPKVELPDEHGGGYASVIAWLWARTVRCPNPACGAQMPLVRSFWLSTKKGTQAWIKPIVNKQERTVRYEVQERTGEPSDGTVRRKGSVCIVCSTSVGFDHVRAEAKGGRMGTQLMAIVSEGKRGRCYLSPKSEHENIARTSDPHEIPDTDLPEQALGFRVQLYGMTKHRDLFTSRQLIALATFGDLISEARAQVFKDAMRAGFPHDSKNQDKKDDTGAAAYADAVATYLAFAVDKMTDTNSSLCTWQIDPPRLRATFGRQALPMTWDFAEAGIFSDAAGDYGRCVGSLCEVIEKADCGIAGASRQFDAGVACNLSAASLICTDPPYYDNIGYADLSDFFYVWLRRALAPIYPELFSTLLVPKEQELIASPFRFGGDREKARKFFENGLGTVFRAMRHSQNGDFPLSIFYAFKQSETESDDLEDGEKTSSLSSTGWETMLQGLLSSGFSITGTWPMRSELSTRNVGRGTNALASSIVLACRPRPESSPIATRREFIAYLKRELPDALKKLQHGNIAPVDFAQAAIGPGMSVFSRYAKVVEADGSPMSVRTALALINQTLDEVLSEQESEFDADTRFCLAWFEQNGMEEARFGSADVLARAKDTAVSGLVEAGVLHSKAGKVRLLRRDEYDEKWDPLRDRRLTIWEIAQHLIRALDKRGEIGAAALVQKVGGLGEIARDLAYRLFSVCERKKWAQEALAYNSLVIAWPEIVKLASAGSRPTERRLFE